MAEFKTGDKVILTGEPDGSSYQKEAKAKGWIGNVVRREKIPDMYHVDFDQGSGAGSVAGFRLSLVPEELPGAQYPAAFQPLVDAALAHASATRELEEARKIETAAQEALRERHAMLEEMSRLRRNAADCVQKAFNAYAEAVKEASKL